jgi:hypothetical protein
MSTATHVVATATTREFINIETPFSIFKLANNPDKVAGLRRSNDYCFSMSLWILFM